ncbi:unnamed protein product, partial [Didymodactylos carnosus]
IYIRRYRHDKHPFKRSQSRTHKDGGLGVWGCLTNYGLSNLVFFHGPINSSKYIRILDMNLPSAFKQFSTHCRRDKIFQQDNARPHVSAKTQQYLKKMNICIPMAIIFAGFKLN